MTASDPAILVAAIYRFVKIADHPSLREPLQQRMREGGIGGSLLLAAEGINGTIAGPPASLRAFMDWLRALRHHGETLFAETDVKWSGCDKMPFRRSKVRLKKEIVTMGVDGIDPNQSVGTYVDPEDWNQLVDDPEVVLIDTRNDYEIEIGRFKGAIDPQTHSFREFPEYVAKHLDPAKHPKVAMYCTGGIRCEKSTAYLKQQGFQEVYHLRGGILNYLEKVPREESRWLGECFVFDQRVAVDHDLTAGEHALCHGCGWPMTKDMLDHPKYERGVACPRCADEVTDDQRARRRERQRQLDQLSSDASREKSFPSPTTESNPIPSQNPPESKSVTLD
ncbi:putative rhodanese-related sulfurtransferase [Neorhodopirellula pilleata]|uniref:tRNA uridine(34) hydroxylase n=1 Tax=Neorhodopirellula pilleata TaxID=2714738 RepID=A0A5C6ABG6_9BACT|nr:putative rhodanese-related sulfurtransferase [Neorhodopirellula pilleata]